MSTTITETDPNEPRPIRPSTVLWGVILLVVAALAALSTYLRPVDYSPAFWLWTIIVVGGLLVLAGIAGAIARSSRKARSIAAAQDKAARYASAPENGSPSPTATTTEYPRYPYTRPEDRNQDDITPNDDTTTDVRDLFR